MRKLQMDKTTVCVIGMGYVGLPLAKAFSKVFKVIGYDNNIDKLKKLNADNDNPNLVFTTEPEEIKRQISLLSVFPHR